MSLTCIYRRMRLDTALLFLPRLKHPTRRLKPNADALKRIIGRVEGHNQRVLADAVERSQDGTVERLGEGGREGGREEVGGERTKDGRLGYPFIIRSSCWKEACHPGLEFSNGFCVFFTQTFILPHSLPSSPLPPSLPFTN